MASGESLCDQTFFNAGIISPPGFKPITLRNESRKIVDPDKKDHRIDSEISQRQIL